MALSGFVEAIEQFQIRGWVFDSASPNDHLKIEIFLQEQLIAFGTASLFRDDLANEGIGAGDHAFIINLAQMLSSSDQADISVFAVNIDNTRELLSRLALQEVQAQPTRSPIQFSGATVDTNEYPVFILGAARSGTSAMAQGLLKIKHFSGQQEGHILDLLAHINAFINNFYLEKSDDSLPDKDTSISLITRNYFSSAIDN
jgi:hypothetical protein